MSDRPLVSVIIPTYNRAHLIGETLDSIVAQTYQNWECIIVDDGSSDTSDEVVGEYVKKDTRFKYYHRPEEHLPGGNGARNYGFKMSQGEYVNWFDSDDLMHKEKLEIQIDILLNTKKNYCVCQTLIFENNIKNLKGLRKGKIFSNDPLNDFIQSKIKWLTQSPIFKSSFLNLNKLYFYEPLKKAQEFEFFVRILLKDKNYCFTSKPLVYLRTHNNQISSKTYDKEKNKSLFVSSFKIIENSKQKINQKSYEAMFNKMLNSVFIAFIKKDFKTSRKFIKSIRQTKNLNAFQMLILRLSLFSYQLFNRGYFFYKYLKYA